MENKIQFIPIKGSLSKIEVQPKTEGAFYVATDTGQIFFDVSSTDRIPLGGTGIRIHQLTSNDPELVEEVGLYKAFANYTDAIQSTIQRNDLLLSMNHDAFYVIDNIETTSTPAILWCQKLAFSGSGSGTDDEYINGKIVLTQACKQNISNILAKKNKLFTLGTEFKLPLVFDTTATLDNQVLVTCILKDSQGKTYQSITEIVTLNNHNDQNPYYLDLGTYLQLGYTFVEITASSSNSKPMSLRYDNWHVVNLILNPSNDFNPAQPIAKTGTADNSFTFACEPVGEIKKELHVVLDGSIKIDESGAISYTGATAEKTVSLDAYGTGVKTASVNISGDGVHHGPHSLKAWLTASEGTTTIYSNILSYEIGIYEIDTDASTAPFVWLIDYPTEIERYEKLLVKFGVYDPAVEPGQPFEDIECYGDDPENPLTTFINELRDDTKAFVWNIASYKSDTENNVINSFNIFYQGNPLKPFFVTVKPSKRDLSLMQPDNLLINLEPTGRTNSENSAAREKWFLKENSTKIVKFSNFNWSTNGWKYDNEYVNYLSISDGAAIEIDCAEAGIESNITTTQKYTFEIRGKIKNIKNYNTLIKNTTRFKFVKKGTEEISGYYTIEELNIFIKDKIINTTNNTIILEEYKKWVDATATNETLPSVESLPEQIYTEKDVAVDEKYDLPETEITSETEKQLNNFVVRCFGIDSHNDQLGTTGFGLGTQETYFNNGATVISAKYKEDEMVTITYVVNKKLTIGGIETYFILIYVNGLLSGIMKNNQLNFDIGSKIIISSDICDFDLYSLRVYGTALDGGAIVQNRLHDLLDIDIFDQNQFATDIALTNGLIELNYQTIVNYNEYISNLRKGYEHLYDRPEMLTMPYMVLKTVDNFSTEKYETDKYIINEDGTVSDKKIPVNKKHKDQKSTNSVIDNRLPYKKDEVIRLVKATFVNPYLDYMINKNKVKEKLNLTDPQEILDFYASHCPSFEAYGADLEVQGTSSQAYPRRNFKLKLKNNDYWMFSNSNIQNILKTLGKDNKLSVKPTDGESAGVPWRLDHSNPNVGISKFTLKVDYMESSGSYNIGFANMINYFYEKHPLDYYKEQNALGDSSISDLYTSYQNAGYRTSVQGFPIMLFQEIDGNYIFIGRYNMITDKGSDEAYGFKMPSEENIAVEPSVSIKNIAECWEMRDNQGTYCAFNPPVVPEGIDSEDYWTDTNPIAAHIEHRYHEADDCLEAIECHYQKKSTDIVSYAKVERKNYYDATGKSHKLLKYAISDPTTTQYNKDPTSFYTYVDGEYVACEKGSQREDGVTYYEKVDLYRPEVDKQPMNKADITSSNYNFTEDDIKGWTKLYYGNLFKLMQWMDKVNPAKCTYETFETGQVVQYYKEFTYIDGYYKQLILNNKDPYDDLNAETLPYCYKHILTNENITVYTADNNFNIELNNLLVNQKQTVEIDDQNYNLWIITEGTQDDIEYNLYITTNNNYTNANKISISSLNINAINPENVDIVFDKRKPVVKDENSEEDFAEGESVTINLLITRTFAQDDEDYRKALFKKEFEKHWNLEYCLIYFIMTELLLCYDSRGKNLMIASWGPMFNGGDYIWFPIFYDIDTQLGINNSGIPTWNYDTDASVNVQDESSIVFSSSSVLWSLFKEMYADEIANKYRILRSSSNQNKAHELSYDFIENVYRYKFDEGDETNLYSAKGVRPLQMLNADAEYKYIKTTLSPNIPQNANPDTWFYNSTNTYGYLNTEGQLDEDTGGKFFYMCQGDRDLSRQLLLRNRFNYLDSYWQAGSYTASSKGSSVVQMRMTANKLGETSDKLIFKGTGINKAYEIIKNATLSNNESQSDWGTRLYNNINRFNPDEYELRESNNEYIKLDSNPHFAIKPFLSQYVSVKFDEILTDPIKSTNQQTVLIKGKEDLQKSFLSTAGLQQQLFYIPGASYLSSFGDLSLKYLDEFFLNSANRIVDLKLGNPSPLYRNPLLTRAKITLNDEGTSEKNRKFLLENIELSGLVNLDGQISVAGSPKLRSFKALRTKLSEVIFGNSLPIHTIYLPSTINKFSLNDCVNITDYLIELTDSELTQQPTGLYFDVNNLGELEEKIPKISNLIKDHLGYGSFDLLFHNWNVENNTHILDRLTNLRITNINWTPFTLIRAEAEIDDSNNLYKKTILNTFEKSSSHTAQDIINNLVYEDKTGTLEKADKITTITDISTLINKSNIKDSLNPNESKYLEGIVYIQNDENEPISQITIQDLELQNSLQIYAQYVEPCRTLIFQYQNPNNSNIATVYYGNTFGKYKEKFGSEYNINPADSNKWGRRILVKPNLINNDFLGWEVFKSTDGNEWDRVTSEDWSQVEKVQTQNNTFVDLYRYDPSKDTFIDPTKEWTDTTKNIIYKFNAYFDLTSYTATFYNVDNKTPLAESVKTYSYNSNHYESPTDILTKPYTGNVLEYSYKFKGWGLIPQEGDEEREVVLADFSDQYPTQNQNYYPIFEPQVEGTKEACLNILDETKFNIANDALVLLNTTLGGKITLPLYLPSGLQIARLCNFEKSKITHIFWYDNSAEIDNDLQTTNTFGLYTETGDRRQGINGNFDTLIYFEMPKNITTIGSYGFSRCKNLFNLSMGSYQTKDGITLTLEDLEEQFFKNITKIEMAGLSNNNFNILYLPSTLTDLARESFYASTISQIIIGSMTAPIAVYIFNTKENKLAFTRVTRDGSNPVNNVKIYCSTLALGRQYKTFFKENGLGQWESDSDSIVSVNVNEVWAEGVWLND